MDEAQIPHLADRLQFAELLQKLRQEKEQGHIFDIENVLERVVNVFKYEEAQDNLLQAALMASAAPSRPPQKSPEQPVRPTTGGALGAGKRTRIDHLNSLPLEEDGKKSYS